MEKLSRVVGLGAILKRLPFRGSNCVYGGSELSVLRNLSSMGHSTSLVSAVPPTGEISLVSNYLQQHQIDDCYILQREGNLGSYSFNGHDTSYPKQNVSLFYSYMFTKEDYDDIFKDCALFHFSGIDMALSPTLRDLCFVFCQEARRRNVLVSFDMHYERSLWEPDEAAYHFSNIIRYADLLFCTDNELEIFLDTNRDCFHNDYITRRLFVLSSQPYAGNARGLKVFMKDVHSDGSGTKERLAYNSKPIPYSGIYTNGAWELFISLVIHHILEGDDMCSAFQRGVAGYVMAHTIADDVITIEDKTLQHYISTLFHHSPFTYYELPDSYM